MTSTPTADAGRRLFLRRGAMGEARLGPDPDAPAARALVEGEVRVAVQGFALTANNVTYAAFGEAMKYWNYFPAPEAAEGCVPVWGFAEVTESRAEGFAPGRRLWGYWPAGTHAVLRPSRVKAAGFTDAIAHRAGLPAAYQAYAFCDADPAWSPALEGEQAVLKPLFTTAFLIDDQLADDGLLDAARRVVMSSASSKTAWATAHCLARRRAAEGETAGRALATGLTSPRNRPRVQALGLYDEVLAYDAVSSLPAHEPAVFIDFAGDAALRAAVHAHFGERLLASFVIGGTHWQAMGGFGSGERLPGPRPKFFFAPSRIEKRSGPPPEGFGPGGLAARLGHAWAGLLERLRAPGEPWLRIERAEGPAAVLAAWQAQVHGQGDPQVGMMATLVEPRG
jgi:hypothetical protein